MNQEQQNLLSVLLEYWQVIFLYAFKYLADIKELLNTLHKDNAVQDNEIIHLKNEITEIKTWLKNVEDKIK